MPFPKNYWLNAEHIYFQAEDSSWGVRDGHNKELLRGLPESNAAAIACILNGDPALGRELLPEPPPTAMRIEPGSASLRPIPGAPPNAIIPPFPLGERKGGPAPTPRRRPR